MGGAFPGDRFNNALYENPGVGHHWTTIQLVGVRSNRSAIGARIRVEVVEHGTRRSIYRHVNSGGSFGANLLRQTIGLGTASHIETLEVFWPTTGRTQTVADVPLDRKGTQRGESRRVEGREPGGPPRPRWRRAPTGSCSTWIRARARCMGRRKGAPITGTSLPSATTRCFCSLSTATAWPPRCGQATCIAPRTGTT